jgi:MoaA/NifB/PqqE/SkfB family radical SAM enzyme
MIEILPKIPAYKFFRKLGYPKLLPINLTVSLTYKCNSRCKTCNIYHKKVTEFTYSEFDRTFKSLGTTPYWFTMSGGEPFLRKDIVDICRSAYENCRPRIINIPTNGILTNTITASVKQIADNSPGTQIIINLSIDHIGKKHDEIRKVENNFARVKETLQELKKLKCINLTIGIHTVISKYNVKDFPTIYEELMKLNPDSYITEIAEERVELGTVGEPIAPAVEDYAKAVDFLSERIKEQHLNGISRITQAFRLKYYETVKRTLHEERQILPCHAGFLSAQISPDGEVWACCIKAEPMGSLRLVDYDFKRVWFSAKANKIRESIKRKSCFCPLANASYTNMLASYRTLAAVFKNISPWKLPRFIN